MQVAVIGGGSVGLLMAGRLRLHGCQVQVVTRSVEQAEALARHGITIYAIDGGSEQATIDAMPFHQSLPIADIYLLATKQGDVESLLSLLHKIPPHAKVVAMQNGMGHEELLKEVLRKEQIFFAVHTEGARRISQTEVLHTGRGSLKIGTWEYSQSKDRMIASLIDHANASGLHAQYVDEIKTQLWKKLIANCLINPLTTIFEVTNGELLSCETTLATMQTLFSEAKQVARACGQQITTDDWQDILMICRNTYRNHSSMLQDLWNKRPTEIDAITGYLVKQGRKHGIPTPLHETVYRIVLLKTSLQRQRGEVLDGAFR